jgi:hypothetical protein
MPARLRPIPASLKIAAATPSLAARYAALQVKAIAHAHVKTDQIDAGVLASLWAAGFLPEVWPASH